jgi:hypothetical protein
MRSASPLFRLRGSPDARRPRSPDVRPAGERGGQGWLVSGASPAHASSQGGHRSPQRPRVKAVSQIVALSAISRPDWARGEVATADEGAGIATGPPGEAGGSDLDLEAHLALARGAEVEFWHVEGGGQQALLSSRLTSSPVGPRVRSFAAAADEGGAVAAMQPVGAGRLLCTADRTETLLLWNVGRRAVTRSLAVPLRAAALTTLRGQLACGAADGTPLPLEPVASPTPFARPHRLGVPSTRFHPLRPLHPPGALLLLEPEVGECVATLAHAPAGRLASGERGERGERGHPCCLQACEALGLLVSLAAGGVLSVWDPRSASALIRTFQPRRLGRHFTCLAAEAAPSANGLSASGGGGGGGGGIILSADSAGGVQAWDVRGGAEPIELEEPSTAEASRGPEASRPVRALSFSSGVASAADGAGLRLWAQPWWVDGRAWSIVARVPSPAACATTCLAAQAASLFCGREDGTVAVWDLNAARGGRQAESERDAESGSISTWRYQLGVATLQDI